MLVKIIKVKMREYSLITKTDIRKQGMNFEHIDIMHGGKYGICNKEQGKKLSRQH